MSELQVSYPAFRLKRSAYHRLKVSLLQVVSVLFNIFIRDLDDRTKWTLRNLLQLSPNSQDEEADLYKIALQRELINRRNGLTNCEILPRQMKSLALGTE